jgi:hypothetical protein
MIMRKIYVPIIVCIIFFACSEKTVRPDDALGTARSFIRYSLDGNYQEAKILMLQDSINNFELSELERRYEKNLSESEKNAYKNASIIIHTVDQVNDSIVIINYSNSYKKKQMPVKVIYKDGVWQVDLNYTFSGNL